MNHNSDSFINSIWEQAALDFDDPHREECSETVLRLIQSAAALPDLPAVQKECFRMGADYLTGDTVKSDNSLSFSDPYQTVPTVIVKEVADK